MIARGVRAVLLFLPGLAWAAPPDLAPYPVMAEVELPASGVARVHLPPGLRSEADPTDGSDLLVVDGAGEPVPFALLRGDDLVRPVGVDVIPTRAAGVYELRLDGAADVLDVMLPASLAATARVEAPRGDGWGPPGPPIAIWRNGDRYEGRIPAPVDARRLRLTLDTSEPLDLPPRVTAAREGRGVPPDVLSFPVTRWGVDEGGLARYAVDLGAPLPVRRIRPDVAEAVFDRTASVEDAQERPIGSQQPIRRVAFGSTFVDDRTLLVGAPLDRFTLQVGSSGQPPLTIDGLAVELEGAQLLVRDAGAGPHRIYARAAPHTRAPWDLQAARDALLDEAPAAAVEPAPAVPNPVYLPPEVRAELIAPTIPIPLERYRAQFAVPAAAGLTRIPLTAEVLAEALPDLADLRLVDTIALDHRQIPYVLRRGGVPNSWGALPFTREERGSTSVLRVALPVADVPVSFVTLRSEAGPFSRRVTVERARGRDREILRAYTWAAEERPGQIMLMVDARAGDALYVTIDNGENPPLPISAVEVGWPAWELVASLPGAPSYLVAGYPRAEAPWYDLEQVGADALSRRATGAVELGPVAPIPPLPIAIWDRLVLYAGVAFTAAGMLALAARIATAKPPDPEVEPSPSG